MSGQTAIQPAFRDGVRESQAVFRLAMHALASPGQIVRLDTPLAPPAPLFAPVAALLLTLCDFETSVWLDPVLADSAEVAAFLRFHTGARLVTSPADAAFAVVADAARMLALSAFAQGTPDYPDRSTTLLLQVETLAAAGWMLEGPGIRGTARFSAMPLPADFAAQMRANRAAFPCGVDILFATRTSLAALPRSTHLAEKA
jgi:alpha-D-ribose 1-methylphosphonate 5-triphosphate synthase subunit PhnH